MKYRALDENGDYQFGPGSRFLTDEPAAVGQAIGTRLQLFTDQWFLDTREGLDRSQILGYNTASTRDNVIKQRILETQGVRAIVSYQSSVEARGFNVSAVVDTIYGRTTINRVF